MKKARAIKTRPRRVAVLMIALRECCRALALPFHLLAYLPRKKKYQEASKSLLKLAKEGSNARLRNQDAFDCFHERTGEDGSAVRHVFIACGESSGEAHAIDLVKALLSVSATLRISGLGGTHLEDSGVDLIENIVDRAVMGVGPVLAQLPFYIKLIGRYLDWIDREKPDLIILVDNPGLNILLAEAAKKRKIPVLYYICPQYWAWGPWRLRRFARAVDVAFAILPFEPPLFWNAGIPTGFAGHPMLAPGSAPKETLAALESETREAEDILALLPGSRKAEIEKHLLPMLTLYAKLRSERGVRAAIIPQKNKERRRHVQAILDQQRALGRLPEGVTALECSATDILGTARLAIAKSGTICLETAITGTPLVVVYKLSNMLDRFFSKNLLSVPWFAAPNLVLGRSAIPEFRVDSASMWEEEIFQAAKELWDEGPARARQLRDLRELRERLAGSGAAKELVRWILGGKGA